MDRGTASAREGGRPATSRERILRAAQALFAARGYENTSTVAIARRAGTSESQLVKHFDSKEGLLQAIFDQGWESILSVLRHSRWEGLSPAERLRVLIDRTVRAIGEGGELRQLLLLEGRRQRKGGEMIAFSRRFLEFVALVDEVLVEMHQAKQLKPGLSAQAVRSALMGAIEGMLRDQLLGRMARYPAHFDSRQFRRTVDVIFEGFLRQAPRHPPRRHS